MVSNQTSSIRRCRSRVSQDGSDQPNISVWWTTGAQSAQLLIDKEVVLGTAWHGRFYTAIKDGAPIGIEFNQGLIHRTPFGIPAVRRMRTGDSVFFR